MKRVLLIGGAGYVGIPVAERLIKDGMQPIIFDSFLYGENEVVREHSRRLGLDVRFADLRDLETLMKACVDTDAVVMLAGLVGDPIVRRYPKLALATNLIGMKEAMSVACTQTDHLIFISTCSNYGIMPENKTASEDTALNPVSDYSRAKVAVEVDLLNRHDSTASVTILRFATAFGVAPRMRFDLTVNEFAKELSLGRELTVYDPDTWRPYCHVEDFAEIILRTIKGGSSLNGEILNAGDNRNNYTKRQIAEMALEIAGDGVIRYVESGSDPRNYRVCFDKVEELLQFRASNTVQSGLKEVTEFVKDRRGSTRQVRNLDLMGNYVIDN